MTYSNLIKAKNTWSSIGKVNKPVNARVSGLEIIVDPGTDLEEGSAFTVPKGKEGADDQFASIKDRDGILGGKLDPRTGLAFYLNPIDQMASKGVHAIDDITRKLQKKYEDHPYYYTSPLAKNTLKITASLTKPMKDLFMKRLNDSLELLKLVPSEEEMLLGLMFARNGKNPICLPGFKDSKDPWSWMSGLYSQSIPKGGVVSNGLLMPLGRENGLNHDFVVNDIQTIPYGTVPTYNGNSTVVQPLSTSLTNSNNEGHVVNSNTDNDNNEKYIGSNSEYGPAYIDPWGNFAINTLGAGMSLAQYFNAAHLRLSQPNFYRANPTAAAALQGLAGVRYNPTWMRDQALLSERRNAYRINNMGGATGGQRYLGRVASGLATNDYLAKIDQNAQQLNNQYKTQYYNALMQYGDNEQQRRIAAAQANYNAYTLAHNAREKAKADAETNLMDYATQWLRNEYQRRMYNGMRSLYWLDILNDKQAKKAIMDTEEKLQQLRDYDANLQAIYPNGNINIFKLPKPTVDAVGALQSLGYPLLKMPTQSSVKFIRGSVAKPKVSRTNNRRRR